MTKHGVARMMLMLTLVFCFVSTVSAQTVSATSCSLSAVQTAIHSAPRGARVTVPIGNCIWSSTVTLTKGITFVGSGEGKTVITNGTGDGTILQISPDSTAIANDEIIRVSGFTFDGAGTGYALLAIKGAPDTGTKPFRNLIIDGNMFQNMGSIQGQGNTAIYVHAGQVRGVIYNNTFDRCDIILRSMGSDTTTEWANAAYNQFSYGSRDNLYFEDNIIRYSSAYSSSDHNAGWIESGQGGRLVVRFNKWDLTNLVGGPSYPQELWDIHGFQNFYGTSDGQTGTMVAEYYDNTITTLWHIYRWFNLRGGWGIFFDNTLIGPDKPIGNVDQYNGGCRGQIAPIPSNYNPLVNNTYAFHNLANGSEVPMTAGSANACGVTENINWWNYAANFNGTVGVGRGQKSSMPTTCSTGVGFWVTDEGSWDTELPPGTSGDFYKCTAKNTWSLYYAPYTYPHPLRTNSQTGSAPSAPTNIRAVVR